MKLKSLAALAALMTSVCAASVATATELKYASSAPSNSPWAKLIDVLVQDTDTRTGGDLKIVPFLNSQLGDEATVIQQVARGRVEMGGFSITAAAVVVPELGLLNAPFLWDSTDQAACALDEHLQTSLRPYFEKRGLVNMSWGETGYQRIFADTPVETVEDLQALKIRVSPAKGSVDAFKAIGVNGVILPLTEINSGLQTGLFDAAELNITFGVMTGAGKLAPVVTRTDHVYLPSLTVVSKRAFDKLPPEQQEVLMTASVPGPEQRRTVQSVEAALTQKLVAEGGSIVDMAPGERDRLRDEMVKSWPQLVKDIGNDAPEVWQLIQDAKAACSD
ncbi:TRAP transporter substrate-binding protein [Chachezhania sediminis]|uniref:TRAP transporter substrate-binding protein n=1 Tax=Chachezhania sediminis TaxID=2599291 RepID=UPI00131C850F|nr:TRAP transporter substrate-binding protein [Chachezhania sediminis]